MAIGAGTPTPLPRRAAGPALAAIAVMMFLALPLLRPPAFFESFLYLVFFWIALATSWAILSGFSGYFSFGHGAFFGAGMYTTANLTTKIDLPFVWSLPFAGAVAMVLGVAIGAVVFRVKSLRGELFALLTLAVTFILATIVINTPLDGGPGVYLSAVPIPAIYATPASTIYFFGFAIAVAALLMAWHVQRARLGRGLMAISDDEDVAEVLGVPTYGYKLAALALSSFIAGVAGGIHAMFVSYVTVGETFGITVPLYVVLMSILGGARHWAGPAIGAVVITALTYAFIGGEWALAGRALIGLILILAILFLPHGVMGLIEKQRRRRARHRERMQDAGHAAPAIAAEDRAQALAAALAAPPAVAPPHAVPPPAAPDTGAPPFLRCDNVHLAFRGVRALAGVTLEVRQGEILGIVGPNGSGKSTLVNAITGFYRPDSGRILFGGIDLARAPAHKIARAGVARTYQIPRPFKRMSVLDNVAATAMFGAAARDRATALREARHWLDFVGLGSRAGALPTELNLHQRKFLELARALASGPRLVLLDEVLAGLTPTEITSAVALIRSIRDRGATIIFIEHNMRAVLELTDRLVVLNYGEVIAQGLPREVMRQPDVVAAYLGAAHA